MSESILTNRNGIIIQKGTWTPVATVLSPAYDEPPTYEEVQSNATYCRIGEMCYISCWYYINISDPGDNTEICIGGLPYPAIPSSGGSSVTEFFSSECGNVTNHTRYGPVRIYGNNTKVLVMQHDEDEYQIYESGEVQIAFSGCYMINPTPSPAPS